MKKKKGKKKLLGLKTQLEVDVFKQIKLLNKNRKVEYETVKLPYTLQRHYIPDFVCSTGGKHTYIEAKGYFRPEDRTKILAVLREDNGIDIRLVFAVNNKLHRDSKMRYGDWCDKHNIPWCLAGNIPKEWFT